jgi:hypothetical protein
MNTALLACLLGVALGAVACGASYPAPTQRLVATESAMREARLAGSNDDAPAAQALARAERELAEAKRQMNDGEYERADGLLARARADADLAATLAREAQATHQATEARRQADELEKRLHAEAP